jgi:hypothetical protein
MVLENAHFKALINNDLQITSLSWHPVCSYLRRSKLTQKEKPMKNILKTILAVAAMISAGSAYAVPTLTLFDGSNTITILDNGSGDSNPALGVVTWIGVIGVWDINIDSGFTKPAIGGVTNPHMDLSFSAHSTAAGTLTLSFSDSGFNASGTGRDTLGGTQDNGSVTDHVRVNGSNVLNIGPLTGSPFSGTATGGITLTSADVLSLVVGIDHTAAGLTTGDKDLTVPDGGSAVALLGIALVGVEALRRKLRTVR